MVLPCQLKHSVVARPVVPCLSSPSSRLARQANPPSHACASDGRAMAVGTGDGFTVRAPTSTGVVGVRPFHGVDEQMASASALDLPTGSNLLKSQQ